VLPELSEIRNAVAIQAEDLLQENRDLRSEVAQAKAQAVMWRAITGVLAPLLLASVSFTAYWLPTLATKTFVEKEIAQAPYPFIPYKATVEDHSAALREQEAAVQDLKARIIVLERNGRVR
jgi:hypothetical protein